MPTDILVAHDVPAPHGVTDEIRTHDIRDHNPAL
jgi:hypothetical protein